MATTLAALILRLTGAVAARDGVPSTAQYSQAVTDAADDFSRRASNQKVATLHVDRKSVV